MFSDVPFLSFVVLCFSMLLFVSFFFSLFSWAGRKKKLSSLDPDVIPKKKN